MSKQLHNASQSVVVALGACLVELPRDESDRHESESENHATCKNIQAQRMW